jgi:hypothetical protein
MEQPLEIPRAIASGTGTRPSFASNIGFQVHWTSVVSPEFFACGCLSSLESRDGGGSFLTVAVGSIECPHMHNIKVDHRRKWENTAFRARDFAW